MSDTTFGGDPIWPVGTEYSVQFSLSCGYVIVAPDGRESTLGYIDEMTARSVAATMTEAYAAGAASSADVLREVREAMTEILPLAERGRSRGIYCGTECLGTCDECKAIVRYKDALAKLPKEAPPASSPRA